MLAASLLGIVVPHAYAAPSVIKVGVTPGTHAEIMEEVRRHALNDTPKLEVVVFDDNKRIDASFIKVDDGRRCFSRMIHCNAGACKQRSLFTDCAVCHFSKEPRHLFELKPCAFCE